MIRHHNTLLKWAFLISAFLLSRMALIAAPPQSPILLLGTEDRFGKYTGEILKVEGFNGFTIDSLSGRAMNSAYLKKFNVVILTESTIDDRHRKLLTQYVKEGGNLIAFRPGNFTDLFGLTSNTGSLSNAYLAIDPKTSAGKGLTEQTLQLHSDADQYGMTTGKMIARLFRDRQTQTSFPAVVWNDYGKGHAVAFTYNLPQNISLTRQGNPDYAAREMDGIDGLRAMDLFTNGWLDTTRNLLNQADEQMRLLSHCIEKMAGYSLPIPRLWYFPDTLKCLITLTNDGEYSEEKDFEVQFTDVAAKNAKMALYILTGDKVSKTFTDTWAKSGHEMSGHPDDTKNAQNPTWQSMLKAIGDKLSELKARYDIPKMHTIVNHWFVWCGKDHNNTTDFSAQAKIEAHYGIGMDLNYAHYDNSSNQGHFLGARGAEQGNYTGSGLPLKFADPQGSLVNIYQTINNVYDQQYMENKDADGFYECYRGLADRSMDNEIYSYVGIKAHNDEYYFSKTPLMKMLDHAQSRKIPVWTPEMLLHFLEAKDEATFSNLRWGKNELLFKLNSSIANNNGLTIMIPATHNSKQIRRIRNGNIELPFITRTVKGNVYAMTILKPGSSYQLSVKYVD